VAIDIMGTGIKLDAVRVSPRDKVKCPALSCSETFVDYRRLAEHIKVLHTLPASVIQDFPESSNYSIPSEGK
jgi:hypothetical protein